MKYKVGNTFIFTHEQSPLCSITIIRIPKKEGGLYTVSGIDNKGISFETEDFTENEIDWYVACMVES
jgi:hypothetical protein